MHRTEGTNNEANLFTDGPPGTTVDAAWLNAVQEEIANVIEGAGLAVSTKTQDTTRDQMYQAIQSITQKVDYTVYNQTTFEALFTRTGANSYDINSDYRSVYIRNIGSGYSFQNVLSGGDTWGDILTNSCALIEFENGAHINFGDFPGAIEVETDDCLLKNVDVRGEGTAAAVTESYRLNAHRVTFDNCKTSGRNSNVDYIGFEGSTTPLHNITSRYVNCTAYDIDGSDKVRGFRDCRNLSSCIVYDLETTVDDVLGFDSCRQLSSCYAYDLDSDSGDASGISDCDNVSSCEVGVIDSISGDAYGIVSCDQVSSCYVDNIDTSTGAVSAGYRACNMISACKANDIDATAGVGIATGFFDCDQISACEAENITSFGGAAEGFNNCQYGAALFTNEAANAGNDWIDSVDAQITNKVSTPSVFT